MTRQLGLSGRTINDLAFPRLIEAVAAAGFSFIGISLDGVRRTPRNRVEMRRVLAANGIAAMDAEVIRLGHTAPDDIEWLLADAAELAARHVIVTCYLPDPSERLERLCYIADLGARFGVRPVLEFAPFSTIPDLPAVLHAIESVGPDLGLLVDSLHLNRSGGDVDLLRTIPAQAMHYAQFCDAAARPRDGSPAGLLHEAREERLAIGEGALPLVAFIDGLPPEMPLMLEILSTALAARFPDPVHRIRHLADTARHWLSALQERHR